MPRRTGALASLAATASFLLFTAPAFAQGDSCFTRVVGVDPSLATTQTGIAQGEGPAQTFYAADTLIRSITVWQLAVQNDRAPGLRIFVIATDSLGVPDGTRVFGTRRVETDYDGDGVHPIPYVAEFDPPLVLPHRGEYAFMMFGCDGVSSAWLSRGMPDAYPEGHLWYQNIRFACQPLSYNPRSYPDYDIVFRIVFERAGGPVAIDDVRADSCAVSLAWRGADEAGPTATIERRGTIGDWEIIGSTPRGGDGRYVFEDASVAPGTHYEYSIDAAGCRFLGFTTVDVPGGLGAAFDQAEIAQGVLRLTWTASTGRPFSAAIERRQVEIDSRFPVDESWRRIATQPSDSTGLLAFDDLQVVPGAWYNYRLAVIQCGRESRMGFAHFVAVPCELGISAPVAKVGPCSIHLTWTTPAGQPATLYRRSASSEWTALGAVISDGTGRGSFDDQQIATGVAYSYRIETQACSQNAFSGQTDVQSTATAVLTAHAAPCAVHLAWQSPIVAGTTASIYRRTPHGTWDALGQVVSDSLGRGAFDDPNVTATARHTYRLVTTGCHGDTVTSEAFVTIPSSPEVTVADIRATAAGVHVRWSVAAGVPLATTVYRRAGEGEWLALASFTSPTTGRIEYDDAQVTRGEHYVYRLGVDVCGVEQLVGEASIDVPSRGFELELAGARPTPVVGELTVRFSLPDQAPARLEMLDLAGRRLLTREVGGMGAGQHVVDLPEATSLASGVYLLRLVRGDQIRTARAVLIR